MEEQDRVLVVDDEPSIRKYLQTLLEVDGYKVTAVSSGKEALEQIHESERPDFIILDVLDAGNERHRNAAANHAGGPHVERHHALLLE